MRLVLTCLLVTTVVACDGTETECEALADSLCEVACGCSDECRLLFASGSTQSFGNELNSPRAQCLTAIAGSCEMGDFDVASCEQVADAPVCVQATQGDALELSESCFRSP